MLEDKFIVVESQFIEFFINNEEITIWLRVYICIKK